MDQQVSRAVRFKEVDQSSVLQSDHVNASLGDFLSRPLRIAQVNWTTGNVGVTNNTPGVPVIDDQFNPWACFLLHPSISKKVENFRLLRGTLVIRLAVNGNPFVFGRLFAAYEPYQTASNFIGGFQENSFPRLHPTNPFNASQLPKLVIDPTSDLTTEMRIPFVYHRDWLDINLFQESTSLLTNGVPGSFGFVPIVDLDTVSTDLPAARCWISVYAWMEDVSMTMPTAYQLEADDEYTNSGPISAPASALANAANYLRDVPVIGKFARATEIGANAVGRIAALFGFSRPIILEKTMLMKNEPYNATAVVDAPMAVQKLTLDSKQELSVDGACVGLGGEDDMTIANICGHESLIYLPSFTSGANVGDLIFRIPVTPIIENNVDVNGKPLLAVNAAGCAAMLFDYWRGPLIYKFTIVCSQYHRGRIMLTYEPDPSVGLNTQANLTYTRIIDIADTHEFEYEVGWGAPTQYLKTNNSQNPVDVDHGSQNGSLYLSVVNPLTAPVTPTAVVIMVSVRAGEGFQLASPAGRLVAPIYFGHEPAVLQESKVEYQLEMDSCSLSNEGAQKRQVMTAPNTNPDSNKVYMGENIGSLRALLKRFQFYMSFVSNPQNLAAGTYDISHEFRVPRFPFNRGYNVNAPNQGNESTFDTNEWPSTPLAYLAQAFCTMRGSIRYHVAPYSTVPGASNVRAYVYRTKQPTLTDGGVLTTVTDAGTPAGSSLWQANAYARESRFCTQAMSGFVPFNLDVQSGISVEMPFYNSYRFVNSSDSASGNHSEYFGEVNGPFDQNLAVTIREYIQTTLQLAPDTSYRCDFSVSAGEDFNMNWFLGMTPYRRGSVINA